MSGGYQNPGPFGPSSYQPSGPSPFEQPRRKPGGSYFAAVLLIGFGFLFLGGVACTAGVYYVVANFDKWVVAMGREAIVAEINDSDLPDDQKKEITTQIDRLVAAYKERKIDQFDLERALTELEDTGAMKALFLYGIDEAYLTDTSLSEKELEQGRRVFQRAVRAVYEGKISEDDFFAALPDEDEDLVRLASNKGPQKNEDDELRESIAKLKLLADNARIPDEPFQINIADEVKKFVDKVLEGNGDKGIERK